MLDEVRSLYGDAHAGMRIRLPRMTESMAFYRGFQWNVPNSPNWPGDSSLDDRERMEVRNYIRPTVRSSVASRLKSRLTPDVVAAHGDPRSRARADASARLLRSFLRNGVFRYRTHFRALMAADIYGAAWLKTYWNPMKGTPQPTPVMRPSDLDPEQMEPELDEFGEVVYENQFPGDIDVDFVDPIHALPDPHAVDPEEMRHIFHWKVMPVGRLNDMFPVDLFGKPTEGEWEIEGQEAGSRQRDEVENEARAGRRGRMTEGGHSEANDLAYLVEYWERPTNRYPMGRLVVYSGHVLVAAGPLPYRFPWTLVSGLNVIPSNLYADGVVHDLKSPQRSINMAESKKREWMEQALNPALLAPVTSGIEQDKFSDIAGEVIRYNPGAKPEWMNVPVLPNALFQERREQEMAIQSISTLSEVSRGEAPQGVTAGRAMAFLHEFQTGVQAPDDMLARDAVREVLQNCLYLARDYYDEGRMVQILGSDGKMLRQVFNKQDYDFEVDVIVEPKSGAPSSRALRQAETLEMLQAGIFDDEPRAERARRMLELDADDRSTVDPFQAHRSRAQMEEALFIEDPFGSRLELLPQDDDQIHLQSHDLFRISEEYLELDPMIRQRFDEHCGAHEEQDAEKKAAFAQEQNMLTNPNGGAGVDGGAPPPKAKGAESPLDGGHSSFPDTLDSGMEAPQGAE